MTANEIIPNLWLGNIKDSQDTLFIKSMDIIINCTKDLPFQDDTKICIRISIEDNLEAIEIANLYKYLDKVSSYINKHLMSGNTILVHCFAGKQRSASIVCAYLMRYCGLTLSNATQLLQTKRIIVFTPLCNFESALKIFESKILNGDI
jgi:hypothetical protein